MKKHQWTSRQRHTLHIAREEFGLDYEPLAAVFTRILGHEFAGRDLAGGVYLHDEHQNRYKHGKSTMWQDEIERVAYTPTQQAARNQARADIRNAMTSLGMTIPTQSSQVVVLATLTKAIKAATPTIPAKKIAPPAKFAGSVANSGDMALSRATQNAQMSVQSPALSALKLQSPALGSTLALHTLSNASSTTKRSSMAKSKPTPSTMMRGLKVSSGPARKIKPTLHSMPDRTTSGMAMKPVDSNDDLIPHKRGFEVLGSNALPTMAFKERQTQAAVDSSQKKRRLSLSAERDISSASDSRSKRNRTAPSSVLNYASDDDDQLVDAAFVSYEHAIGNGQTSQPKGDGEQTSTLTDPPPVAPFPPKPIKKRNWTAREQEIIDYHFGPYILNRSAIGLARRYRQSHLDVGLVDATQVDAPTIHYHRREFVEITEKEQKDPVRKIMLAFGRELDEEEDRARRVMGLLGVKEWLKMEERKQREGEKEARKEEREAAMAKELDRKHPPIGGKRVPGYN